MKSFTVKIDIDSKGGFKADIDKESESFPIRHNRTPLYQFSKALRRGIELEIKKLYK